MPYRLELRAKITSRENLNKPSNKSKTQKITDFTGEREDSKIRFYKQIQTHSEL